MGMVPNLHPVQTGIVQVLAFRASARFAELKTANISRELFTFHLKRLRGMGIVERVDDQYRLSAYGKGVASQMGSLDESPRRNSRVGVLICCVRVHPKTGVKEYAVQERLKHPFFGCFGFMAGRVQWGETVAAAAKRKLKDEQGLTAKLTLVGVKHKMDATRKEVLEDKYFFVFRGDAPKGTLKEHFMGGRNFWATRAKLLGQQNLYGGVEETMDMIDSNQLSFLENTFKVTNY